MRRVEEGIAVVFKSEANEFLRILEVLLLTRGKVNGARVLTSQFSGLTGHAVSNDHATEVKNQKVVRIAD